MLSALSAWTRRQHAELGGSGRSWGTEGRSKSRGDGRTFRGRLDADLLWTRARRATHCDAILEEIPEAWSALYRQVQSWRSRLTTADFSVVDGLIFLQQPSALQDPEVLLRMFHFMAHHGLKLSATTEYRIEQALPALAATPPRGAELWLYLQETLLQPHAADALRSMQSLRLLTMLLPELKIIDSLVVRD